MEAHVTVIVCSALILAVLVYVIYLLDNINYQIKRTRRILMGAVQDAVDAVTAQISKGTAEVVAKVAELEAREPDLDLSELKAAAQALDDLNVDVVVEEPETPAEPTE